MMNRKRSGGGVGTTKRPGGAGLSSIEGLFFYLWTLCNLWLEFFAVIALGRVFYIADDAV